MGTFDTCLYVLGAVMTIICAIVSMTLFFTHRSKDKFGRRIELENGSKENPWTLSTWIAGVFVAGTGVALMYAPSDLIGYVHEGLNPVESITMLSLLNGAPVWALYSVMGLWYMKHMDSKIGKIAAMLSTVLGMAISLWTGMNTVAKFIGFTFPGMKFLMAAMTVMIAMFSASKNLLKGMSKLAFLVFTFAFMALISTPNTEFEVVPIQGALTGNFLKKFFFGETTASWIFWFLSWTPTVARWLAHISKGRTMKEYIAGTMILPTVIAVVWMAVSWKYQNMIMSFNLAADISTFIPCMIFIASGILFMTGTLDSDCKVFTEDLEELSDGRLKRKAMVPLYGLLTIFVFCLFISGMIVKPFAFNEYSSLVFMPLMIWSIVECLKMKSKA